MKNKGLYFSILAADLMWIVLALLASILIRYQGHLPHVFSEPGHGGFGLLAVISAAVWVLLYQVMDLDGFRGGWQASAVVSKIALAVTLQFAVILSWGYFVRLYYSRLVLSYYFLLLLAGITLIRLSFYGLLRVRVLAGKVRSVVLIGDSELSREIAHRLRRHPEFLYRIVGFLTPFGSAEMSNGNGSAGTISGLSSMDATDFLRKRGVQELIALPKHAPGLEMQSFLVRCQEEGMHVHVLPQPYELYVSRPRMMEVDGVPLIFLERPHFSLAAQVVKRVLDLLLAALLILPATALLAVAGGTLWLRERRFLRKETRCGKNGRPFAMYRLDVETEEDRASAFHKFLRHSSLSELPQIFNVLRGQMSLVGPRPEAPDRVREYSEWQKQRLKTLPGMTGLAQVNGLREEHSSQEKTRHDLQYILHWTPLVDVVLLLQTVWTLAARLLQRRAHIDFAVHASRVGTRPEAARRVAPSVGE